MVRVFAISGANMAVIVRHGKYLTVYQNLVNVKVKAGDKYQFWDGDWVMFFTDTCERRQSGFEVYDIRRKEET
ncbi:MAG: hypothetical protein MZV63_71550 [Marinilabiliales bacterium]|nr:hypothetical protein [Marinilabiliales bacterium]